MSAPDVTRRRALALTALALLLLLPACGRESAPAPTGFGAEAAAARLAEIRARQQRDAAALQPQELIVLGYLERLRLGLGSPLRLAEFALFDPRLAPALQSTAGWAVLQATRAGVSYAPDADALAGMAPPGQLWSADDGAWHLAFVAQEMRGSRDPRAAELALRLAYELRSAEAALAPDAPRLLSFAAALARDRELARRDVERLLAHSAATGEHPLRILPEWRRARHFEVERPTAAPLPAATEREAARRAPLLLDALRERAPLPDSPAAARPWLDTLSARRLGRLADSLRMPPQAALRVALDRYRRALLRDAGSARARAALQRLLTRGEREEQLAAEHVLAAARLAPRDAPLLPLALLEAAVAMRPLAQEPIWYPGYSAPTTAQLKRTYGLARVGFDADVPQAWRPFYRRMLAHALDDLRRAVPTLELRGLGVRFGRTGRERTALAIHDPHGRTVVLPPATSAGVLAHELAHDLDWQTAQRRYGTRLAYATDHALRRRKKDDPFAAAVRALPTVAAPLRDSVAAHHFARRPAETFARTFDGYVAYALAAHGRSNGYLSSVQDDALPGHGLAIVPDARGQVAEAFLPVLRHAGLLHEAGERDFLRACGAGRVAGVTAPVRELLSRSPPPTAAHRPGAPERARERMHARLQHLAALSAEVAAEHDARLRRRPLLHAAAEADAQRLLRVGEAALRHGIVDAARRELGVAADADFALGLLPEPAPAPELQPLADGWPALPVPHPPGDGATR